MNSILIIDDDPVIRESLYLIFNELKYRLYLAGDGNEGLSMIEKMNPDMIITDLKMPGISGFDILNRIRSMDKKIPVIIISAFDDMHSIIKAMEMGAYDYIEKPIEIERLKKTVTNAIETNKLSRNLNDSLAQMTLFEDQERIFIGKTKQIKDIYKKIGQVCSSRVTVLIQGESGTGKELITKIIHNSGITKNKPLVAVNCTALTETLLESELFGHMKGSFTGAIRNKKGKFELAEDGTIFLDEISEISHDLQVKLLRVLEAKEFEQVGGETTIPVRARIIAATNKDLKSLVDKGAFRKDLFYRLNVFTINIPALRERKEDIPLLVIEFLNRINKELHKNVRKVPYEVMELLQNHSWVGNVRELYNTLLQGVVLSKGDVLEKENILLKNNIYGELSGGLGPDILKGNYSLDEFEKLYILATLKRFSGNKQRTCKFLGITKPTLNNKLKKYAVMEG